MSNIDVSILIPTFNRLWCLPEAIESCRNTRCKTEIIVINDGSTDDTAIWLNEQKGIVVITQQNWGKCWAVNKGFEVANGKYIRFLDSDDLLAAGAIDEQFLLAEKEQADVVVSGHMTINNQHKVISKHPWINCDDFIAQQLGECDSSHYSAYLFKKSFIKEIPHRPEFSYRDDRLFVLEMAIELPKISVYNKLALKHRIHEKVRLQKTIGHEQQIQNYQHLHIYKKVIEILNGKGMLTERRINAAINILWPLAHWIAKYDLSEGTSVFNWIKKLKPNFKFPKGILGVVYTFAGFANTERILRLRRKFIKY